MNSGFVRAAMWVAVFVVPGGVLLLPALMWRRLGAQPLATAAVTSTSTPDNAV